MNPDGSTPVQPAAPAALPTASSPLAPSAPNPNLGATPNPQQAEKINEQVKALVEQYQQNPYQLSNALQQLKTKHLAETFRIMPNSTEH